MGRISKLTEKQWNELERRLLAGEAGRVLGREFGVSEAAIRKRLGTQTKQIKQVANQVFAAELALSALPIGAQISARTLADELKSISSHLASAGKYGAMTAHRLSAIANGQIEKIDDVDPMASGDVLTSIAGLTKIANSSSEIAINLLRANKEFVDNMNGGSELSSMSDAEIIAELESIRVSA